MNTLGSAIFTALASIAVIVSTVLSVGLTTPSPEDLINDLPLSSTIVTTPDLTCDGTPIRGGCFSTLTPDTIYISPDLSTTELTYVILHEYAHLSQHHNGQPLSECQADAFAMLHGADVSLSPYDCDTPTEQSLASITLTR